MYKISCILANYAYEHADGIIYPSFQRFFEGLNVAIKSDIVDKKLRFKSALKETFVKIDNKVFHQSGQKRTIKVLDGRLFWSEEERFDFEIDRFKNNKLANDKQERL